MEWISEHWKDVLAVIGAVDAALYLIVKLTPTQWDDNAFTTVHNFIVKFFPKK